MNKAQLEWMAKSLGLHTQGTIPELEKRIAVYNTLKDAAIIANSNAHAAMVMNRVVALRHQLAMRAELKDVDESTTKDFAIEEKLDGMRAWLVTDGEKKYAFSRHYTKDLRLNAIANIKNVDLNGFTSNMSLSIFDVELYVNNPRISRHDRLGLSIAAFSTYVEVKQKARPVILDAVMLNGLDISKYTYEERRYMMAMQGVGHFLSPQFQLSVHDAFDLIVNDNHGEGLVLKQKDAPYLFGERAAWYKFKAGYANGRNEYTVIITGMGDRGKNRNAGKVGSVTVSDEHGQPLGEVGTFDDYTRDQLTNAETGLLKPWLIGKRIEVVAMELTRDKKLRHAAFKRFLD